VQKYFSTKEEMFDFALELTGEYLEQRWENVARAATCSTCCIGSSSKRCRWTTGGAPG
jgi:hypothetical protein